MTRWSKALVGAVALTLPPLALAKRRDNVGTIPSRMKIIETIMMAPSSRCSYS